MSFYFSKKVESDFDKAIEDVTAALKEQGFGVLTDIDVKATFKKKINVDFRRYRILGACNPGFAHQALETDDKLGVMLPCNVVVQEFSHGVEISALDPVVGLGMVGNDALSKMAEEVKERIEKAVFSVK